MHMNYKLHVNTHLFGLDALGVSGAVASEGLLVEIWQHARTGGVKDELGIVLRQVVMCSPPVSLQELGQVFTRLLQLVLIQNHIKHFLHTERESLMKLLGRMGMFQGEHPGCTFCRVFYERQQWFNSQEKI